MPVPSEILALVPEITKWRHHLHACPELAFEEKQTGDFIAGLLSKWNVPFVRGIGDTGIVATITGRSEGESIGLRADMDALPIREKTGLPYASKHEGKMHACGHDGHMAMLLGAVRHLASTRTFRGTVYAIFQPAEEYLSGAKRLCEEGLFDKFPMSQVFAVHNWPALEPGCIAVHKEAVMAASDWFDIALRGPGGHAALPKQSKDTVGAASRLVLALQEIKGPEISTFSPAVLSVTQVQTEGSLNVIPAQVTVGGIVRCFSPDLQSFFERRIGEISRSVGELYGISTDYAYHRLYPATVNDPRAAKTARQAALEIAGKTSTIVAPPPSTTADDFSFMLQRCPGAYIWIGQGGQPLHTPTYDFNDAILGTGIAFLSQVAKIALAPSHCPRRPCVKGVRHPFQNWPVEQL